MTTAKHSMSKKCLKVHNKQKPSSSLQEFFDTKKKKAETRKLSSSNHNKNAARTRTGVPPPSSRQWYAKTSIVTKDLKKLLSHGIARKLLEPSNVICCLVVALLSIVIAGMLGVDWTPIVTRNMAIHFHSTTAGTAGHVELLHESTKTRSSSITITTTTTKINNITSTIKVGNRIADSISSTILADNAAPHNHRHTTTVVQQQQMTSAVANHTTNTGDTCHFYLAKSKIPDSGLGIFTTRDISKGDIVGPPDIVIQVPDLNPYHVDALSVLLFDYAWQGEETGGQYEGQRVYSLIPGFGMLANGHRHMYNTVQHYGSSVDNAGITRDEYPGAGSSSHYHDFEFRATSDIGAGSEILLDYGPNWFDEREIKGKIKTPENLSQLVHSVDWLRTNGICLDNIRVGISSNPQAGRGAFSTRAIAKGDVVAPAPIVQIMHRKSLEVIRIRQDPRTGMEVSETSQSILLNYCFGHKNSSLLFFPYAPLVNYINHSSKEPNVKLRWSQSSHHDVMDVTDLTLKDLKLMKHAGLMLEFVATRDINPGEEILLDYGQAWENAWSSHVERWSSPSHDHGKVSYIQDLDNEKFIRTKEEQQKLPYPNDIFTSCYYSYADSIRRGRKRSDGVFIWTHSHSIFYDKNLRPCIVLDRYQRAEDEIRSPAQQKDYVYTVAILNRFGLGTDERIPHGQAHIVTSVPRNAIRFSNKIYTSDQHLPTAFRHEINLDYTLFPSHWLDLP